MKKLSLAVFLLFSFFILFNISSAQSTSSFTRDLKLGSKGNDVTALQNYLIANKYLTMPAGAAKGTFGPLTQKALIQYQKANGITPASGYFGAKSRGKLTGVAVVASSPSKSVATISTNLDWRSTGKEVTILQNFLKSRGYLTGTYKSGTFDTKTEAALKKYSGRAYLTTATRTKINNILRGPAPIASSGSSSSRTMATASGGNTSSNTSNTNSSSNSNRTTTTPSNANPNSSVSGAGNTTPSNSGGNSNNHSSHNTMVIANPTPQPSDRVVAGGNATTTGNSGGNSGNTGGNQEGRTSSSAGNWSSPATWGGTVPAAGRHIFIPAGKTVTLDTDINVASLVIEGTLEVARRDTNITAGYIVATTTGQFIAGTEQSPFTNNLTITLTGTDRGATSCGGRSICISGGGKIELIGIKPTFAWTMLNANAPAGATSVTLQETPVVGWDQGDEFIITSSDYFSEHTEKRVISSVSGNVINFETPLVYYHHGTISSYPNPKSSAPQSIDERSEVGLLSHNIKIRGAEGISGVENSSTNGYGAGTMIIGTASVGKFQGVEFTRAGQAGITGRYPIHWHNVNNGGANSWIQGSAVNQSFNRCMTVHKTNRLQLTDNVAYDTFGHCYFLEDGFEVRNVFTHNLGAGVKLSYLSPAGVNLDSMPHFDNVDGGASVFWIVNPDNDFIDNAAAGIDAIYDPGHNTWVAGGWAFWYSTPNAIDQTTRTISNDPNDPTVIPNYNPRAQPMGIFRGNRAHSLFGVGNGIHNRGTGLFLPAVNGTNFDDYTGFSLYNGGVWSLGANGGNTVYNDFKVSGGNGFSVAGRANFLLKDSLVVAPGSTKNPATIFSTYGTAGNIKNQQPMNSDELNRSNRSALWNYEGIMGVVDSVLIGFDSDSSVPTVLYSFQPGANINPEFGTDYMKNTIAIDSEIGIPNHDAKNASTMAVIDYDDALGNGSGGAYVRSGSWVATDDNNENPIEWITLPTGCKDADNGGVGFPAKFKANNITYQNGEMQNVKWCPVKIGTVSVQMYDDRGGMDNNFDSALGVNRLANSKWNTGDNGIRIRRSDGYHIDVGWVKESYNHGIWGYSFLSDDYSYEVIPYRVGGGTPEPIEQIHLSMVGAYPGRSVVYKVPWIWSAANTNALGVSQHIVGAEYRGREVLTDYTAFQNSTDIVTFYLDTTAKMMHVKIQVPANAQQTVSRDGTGPTNLTKGINISASMTIRRHEAPPVVSSANTNISKVTNGSSNAANITKAIKDLFPSLLAPKGKTAPSQPASVINSVTPSITSSAPSVSSAFYRNLKVGSEGEDVRALQRFLNNNGYTVSTTGIGSPGNETIYFGQATKNALIKWQIANGLEGVGEVGPKTFEMLKKKSGY